MMSDPTPRVFPGTTAPQMNLERAHDLNYRFTHGIDAKSKASECYTCHSAQEFCGECHEAGDNNITSRSIKPAWLWEPALRPSASGAVAGGMRTCAARH